MARPQIRFSLGVKIHMSKNLFLTAASVAALAFAGTAVAGEISGSIGGVPFNSTTKYTVASEVIVDAANAIEGTLVATNTLAPSIVVGPNAQRDHLVTFNVTGATVSNPTLTAADNGVGDVVSTLLSNSDGEIIFLVTVSGDASQAVSTTVTSFTMTADIAQTSKTAIGVANDVVAVIGGMNITVDTAPEVVATEYASLLKSLSVATVNTSVADLPSYVTLNDGDAGAQLSTGFSAVNSGVFYEDLDGDVVTAGEMLAGGTVTVRGPIINDEIEVFLSDGSAPVGAPVPTTEGNTAVYELSAGQAASFATGSYDLVIEQTDDDAFRQGTYRLSWTPTASAGFVVPTVSTVDAGVITLEGTNFVAPWVSGTGAATSVIRIGNSNSAASGAVTVRLLNAVKVVSGVATPVASDVVYEAGVVPAGADLQITSSQLVGAFGDFTRGDVQVTINSATDGFTAKLRNTRDGQTFEQSIEKQ